MRSLVLLRSKVGFQIACAVIRRATARAAVLGALSAGTCRSGKLVLSSCLVASCIAVSAKACFQHLMVMDGLTALQGWLLAAGAGSLLGAHALAVVSS